MERILTIVLLGLAITVGCGTTEPSGRNRDDDNTQAGCDVCDHARAACDGVTSCDCSVQVPLQIEACVLDAISCEAVVACLDAGGECSCDATYGCDADCACDPECKSCDTTTACDEGCISDPDCSTISIGGACSCAPEPGLIYCSNAACETTFCLWFDGMEQYCSRPCAGDTDCPTGMQCVWFQGIEPWCAYA